jgi:hypothetical protein
MRMVWPGPIVWTQATLTATDQPQEALVPQQPNILIIWGDDIGVSNLSCYSETA